MASLLTNLLSGGAGSLLNGVSGIINSIKGKSPEDAAKLAELTQKYQSDILAADLEQAKLAAQAIQAQSDVNLQEAKSDNLFVAGWRPWIGWVCGAIFAINFIVGPIVNWILIARGISMQFPKMDLSEAMPVLLGMLGLGGMRTFEKTQLGSKSVGH
jgi:hypothetical protein